MADFEPFDRATRRRARARAAGLIAGREAVLGAIAAELDARLALAPAPRGPRLRVGLLLPPPPGCEGFDPAPGLASVHGGLSGDEDRTPLGEGRYAEIGSLMTLHGVNDLPGALILIRRALAHGGRFVGALATGASFGAVREAFLAADLARGRGAAPRVGPAVDPAQGAGLLARAGFRDPVAELDTLTLRYRSLADLARDVRAHGESGWLAVRPRGLMTPAHWAAAEAAFRAGAGPDGRVPVALEILYLSGTGG